MSIQIKPDMADRIQVSNEATRPETPQPAKRNWRLIGGGAVVVVLAIVAVAMAAGWLFGEPEGEALTQAQVPLIKAEEGPVMVRPEDPGGMEVPNRDMLVYRRFESAGEAPPVERLLPSSEQPVVPPRPVAAPGREIAPVEEEPEMEDASSAAETVAELIAADQVEDTVVTPEPPEAAPVPPAPAAKPEPEPVPAPRAPATPVPSRAPATVPAGAYQVQLLAVHTRDQARAAWGLLSKKHADVLGGLQPNIVRADLGGKGVIYRLRAGPAGDEGKARAICASLAKRRVDCLVVAPSG